MSKNLGFCFGPIGKSRPPKAITGVSSMDISDITDADGEDGGGDGERG